MVDPDNDFTKCRMAEGFFECGGICSGLRDPSLDGVSISYKMYIAFTLINCHHVFGVFL